MSSSSQLYKLKAFRSFANGRGRRVNKHQHSLGFCLLDLHCLKLPAYHMLIFQALLLEFKRPQDHSPRPLSLHPHGWMSMIRCLGSIPRFVASPWSCTWASAGFHTWNAPEAITLVQGSSSHRLRHPGPDPSGFPRDLPSVFHWDVGIAVRLGR